VQLTTLEALRTLDLRNNQIEVFPPPILSLRNLQVLLLGFNHLRELADKFADHLSQLFELDVGSNQLTHLPQNFHLMSNLSSLNVENNSLDRIPLELGVCENLKSLLITGNPQRMIKYEMISKGTAAIKDALRSRIPVDSPLLAVKQLQQDKKQQQEEKKQQEEQEQKKERRRELKEEKGREQSSSQTQKAGATTSVSSPVTSARTSVSDSASRAQAVKAKASTTTDAEPDPEVQACEKRIQDLNAELENFALSGPKKFALKKQLALERSHLIKLQRQVKQ